METLRHTQPQETSCKTNEIQGKLSWHIWTCIYLNVYVFQLLYMTSSFHKEMCWFWRNWNYTKQSQVSGIDQNPTMLSFNILVSIDSLVETKTMDLSARLWGITTEVVGFIPQNLVLRSIVLGWIHVYQNWSIQICLSKMPRSVYSWISSCFHFTSIGI